MRRLFIGDIHGCSEELSRMIQEFRPEPDDILISVGDVINKGPDSLGALSLVEEHKILCVQGNHDRILPRALENVAEGRETGKELKFLKQFRGREEWALSRINSWPLWLELGDIWVVHAGLDPRFKHPSEMSAKILTTIRTWDGQGADLNRRGDKPWFECINPPKMVIYGHWAMRGLVDLPAFKGLDTGCVYGNSLTAYCPEEKRFYRIKARKEWCPV